MHVVESMGRALPMPYERLHRDIVPTREKPPIEPRSLARDELGWLAMCNKCSAIAQIRVARSISIWRCAECGCRRFERVTSEQVEAIKAL